LLDQEIAAIGENCSPKVRILGAFDNQDMRFRDNSPPQAEGRRDVRPLPKL
jgi:hypothetical protein